MQGKVLFISGWAGTKQLFPTLSKQTEFIVPFNETQPDEISDMIRQTKRNTIAGWSTGAHMILKNLHSLPKTVKSITLFAPFQRFTDDIPERIVKRMIKMLDKKPEKVVADFYTNCGITPLPEQQVWNVDMLKTGLEYLIASDWQPISMPEIQLHIIHGRNDQIVPYSAAEKLMELFPDAKLTTLDTGHYIDEETILNGINENIS